MMGTSVRANPSQIRLFLEASSPKELVRLQLQTNTLLKGRADYTDIQYVEGKWYAWFMADISQPEVMRLAEGLLDGA